MRVMFFADPHGHIEALGKIKEEIKEKDVELAICAGDLTVFEADMHRLLKIVSGFNIPVLMMPGNHESDAVLKKACERYDNIFFMNNGYYEKDNIFLVCIEGNGFAYKDKEFERVAKKILPELKKKRKEWGKLFSYTLVTHAPPFNTKLDDIFSEHVGNKSIRDFIIKTRPKYAISGHIHENERKKDRIKDTVVINPGMYGMIFNL